MTAERQDDEAEEPEEQTTIDPYTGERKPVPEDADKVVEIMPVDDGDHRGEDYLLEEETSMDALAADEDAEAAAELAASYTDDEEVKAEFLERQGLAVNGRKVLEEDLEEHHSTSPRLSGGDLDADWASANQAGEETVGGSTPTPDQDRVDELGEAAGLTFQDDEPLHGGDKLEERDRHRWELNPASADEREEGASQDEGEEGEE